VAGVIDLLEVLIAGEGAGLATGPKARLEMALLRTYREAGITHDRATHERPAPLLADLRAPLDALGDDVGLAERLGRYGAGALASTADVLSRMAKQARKRWCQTIAASQDPLDFTATAAGRALILNSCRTWLLRCEEVALPDLARATNLSEQERADLVRYPAGQG